MHGQQNIKILANVLFSVCMILMILWALLSQSLRHCTTTQKVVGLTPDGALWVFLLPAILWPWGSSQPLNRNEYQGFKGGWCIGLTTLPPSFADCLEILRSSTPWKPKGPSRPVNTLRTGDADLRF